MSAPVVAVHSTVQDAASGPGRDPAHSRAPAIITTYQTTPASPLTELDNAPPLAARHNSGQLPMSGCRKRKAYTPRNSCGADDSAMRLDGPAPQPACKRSRPLSQQPSSESRRVMSDADVPGLAPALAQQLAMRSVSQPLPDDVTPVSNASDSAAPENTAASAGAATKAPCVATQRPRRRGRSDPCIDADPYAKASTPVTRRTSKRRSEPGTAMTRGAAAKACAEAGAATARSRRTSEARPAGITAEQRMFQEFRKLSCAAYTGVIVHCQNMKLEARVNMVSYLRRRERKISGGQVYIAYMTNPHQAAIVHDITASIMTAEGIDIYHNHTTEPCCNADVALERLNYLEDLSINLQRGGAKTGDSSAERKSRADISFRQQHMLTPDALKVELHKWVSHDSQWMPFNAWLENVLFEGKLALLCLQPKIIDEAYLKPHERQLLLTHLKEYANAATLGAGFQTLVHTHMYDQLVTEKQYDKDGRLCGYKLIEKRYRRRRPELRSGSLKWAEDKEAKSDLSEAPTPEDQRRVDIAWGVLQRWLAHFEAAYLPPRPDYEAVDANYYVTWRHFARWINSLLETVPGEIAELQNDIKQVQQQLRQQSTRRVRPANPDPRVLEERITLLQSIHDKYRAIVLPGTSIAERWVDAAPLHRQAFENFFPGWKGVPPSLVQPQRKASVRGIEDYGYQSAAMSRDAAGAGLHNHGGVVFGAQRSACGSMHQHHHHQHHEDRSRGDARVAALCSQLVSGSAAFLPLLPGHCLGLSQGSSSGGMPTDHRVELHRPQDPAMARTVPGTPATMFPGPSFPSAAAAAAAATTIAFPVAHLNGIPMQASPHTGMLPTPLPISLKSFHGLEQWQPLSTVPSAPALSLPMSFAGVVEQQQQQAAKAQAPPVCNPLSAASADAALKQLRMLQQQWDQAHERRGNKAAALPLARGSGSGGVAISSATMPSSVPPFSASLPTLSMMPHHLLGGDVLPSVSPLQHTTLDTSSAWNSALSGSSLNANNGLSGLDGKQDAMHGAQSIARASPADLLLCRNSSLSSQRSAPESRPSFESQLSAAFHFPSCSGGVSNPLNGVAPLPPPGGTPASLNGSATASATPFATPIVPDHGLFVGAPPAPAACSSSGLWGAPEKGPGEEERTTLQNPTLSGIMSHPAFQLPKSSADAAGTEQQQRVSEQAQVLPERITERQSVQRGKLRTITIRGTSAPIPGCMHAPSGTGPQAP